MIKKDKLHLGGFHDLKNKIVVFDRETGKKIFERENLVVESGRIFTLENIANILTDDNSGVTGRRQLLYFTIGDGGVNVGEHDAPLDPLNGDTALANALSFGTVNTDSMYCKLSGSDYYGKFFETLTNAERWDIDSLTNKVALKYLLKVEPADARGEAISEIGIHFGRIDTGSVVDDGLFSRITFPSKFLLGTNAFDVVYYIYV